MYLTGILWITKHQEYAIGNSPSYMPIEAQERASVELMAKDTVSSRWVAWAKCIATWSLLVCNKEDAVDVNRTLLKYTVAKSFSQVWTLDSSHIKGKLAFRKCVRAMHVSVEQKLSYWASLSSATIYSGLTNSNSARINVQPSSNYHLRPRTSQSFPHTPELTASGLYVKRQGQVCSAISY